MRKPAPAHSLHLRGRLVASIGFSPGGRWAPFPAGGSYESPGALHWSPRRPVRAPDQIVLQEAEMTKYICTVCDYVYDPAVGDPDSGIEPGTAFADLPDDWVCPECGVEKEDFEALED